MDNQPSARRGHTAAGPPVRLLTGTWDDISAVVAVELRARSDESAAQDLPSTPRSCCSPPRRSPAGTTVLRPANSAKPWKPGGRAFTTPRNRTAGRVGSPVDDLLALISYLIDPVTKAHVNGRRIEVHATCREADRWPYAVAAPPEYRIADTHAALQKQFRKSQGGNITLDGLTHIRCQRRVHERHRDMLDHATRWSRSSAENSSPRARPPDYDQSSARRDHQASAAVIALSASRMPSPTSPAVAAQCKGTRATAPGSQRCSSRVSGSGAVPS